MLEKYLQSSDHNILLQLVVIVIGTVIVAKIMTFLVASVGKRLAKKTKTDIDDDIIDSLKGPIFYTIVLVGIYMSLRVSFFNETIKNFTLPFFQTTLTILWSVFLVRLTKIVLEYFSSVEKVKLITVQTLPLFLNMSFIIIWALSVYVMFDVWGVNMTAWLASAGVAGIAIGFAAKDTLANLISGIFILTDAPYKIGDWIVLDSGERGRVTDIGIRTTRIINTDDMEVTIPNAVIGGAKLINESGGKAGKTYRVRVPFGVAYGSDIDEVERIVLNIANNNEHVLKHPKPRARFCLFGPSSLDYQLLFWVETSALRGKTIHEINHAIYKEFAKNNIEIPFAKQDLYIKEFPQNKENK